MPFRGPDGFCVDCDVNEPGELLGCIDPSRSTTSFNGYTSKDATEKKILHNLFQKGDCYFRTGDLLRYETHAAKLYNSCLFSHDAGGWLYFVDRIGDTFRWKGENVSTNEVSEVVSVFPGVLEANVYGVKVPGNEDGRACMAAIVLSDEIANSMDGLREALDTFDFQGFSQEMNKNLAKYARPLFLRFLRKMQQTATFKQQKAGFVKAGIDISVIEDPLFLYDEKKETYLPLTKERYAELANGRSRL